MRVLFLFLFFQLLVSAQDLTKVSLQLQWKHQFEFAGFYAAKEKGFYKDIGLDVEFIEYHGDEKIVDKVLSKKADFGLTYASLIAEYLDNKPVVFLANYFKQSPLVLVSQKQINTPEKLRGKKIMGVSDDIDSITLKLMLEKFGISMNDIIVQNTTFNLDDFITKKIDAMAVFTTNEVYELDRKNIKYNIFNPSIYGTEYYDLNLFTSKEFALNNKKLTKDFMEASTKGWRYALNNLDEIIELILQKYNTQNRTKKALEFEAKQISQIMLARTEPIGSIDINRVKLMAKNFIELGYVENQRLDKIDDLLFNNKSKKYIEIYDELLNKEEKDYLEKKPYITMCVDPNWEPYEKIENGKYKGFVAQIVKIIEMKINKDIVLIPTKTWEESLANIKNGKCEIIPFLNESEDRAKFLNFSPTIYEEPDVIITSNKVSYMDGFNSIKGMRLGLIKGYMSDEHIAKNYSQIDVKYIKNYEEGLKKIEKGEIDATINSLLGSIYLLKKFDYPNLKISGKTNFTNYYKVGVNKKDEVLLHIISKAVLSISQKQKDQLLEGLGVVKSTSKVDYLLVKQILFVGIIAALFLLYRQYILKKTNKKLRKEMDSELKRSQKQEKIISEQKKMLSMGQMISNIAHQWRQPLMELSSIHMELEAKLEFGEKIDDKELKNSIDKSNILLKYMSDTIDDFSNFFSKDKKKEDFEINHLIENALRMNNLVSKNSEVEVFLHNKKDCNINTYRNELLHVLVNIIGNAKDILIEREIKNPKIEIDLYEEDESLSILIHDNGGGIKDKDMEEIFEPFYTNKQNGTGIGLFMSKFIIETKMNGKIEVKNIKNGALFMITIATS